jgi:large subunit ribosomal protein L21
VIGAVRAARHGQLRLSPRPDTQATTCGARHFAVPAMSAKPGTYAVIANGPKQFKVHEGDLIDVDLRRDVAIGAAVEFANVLTVTTADGTTVGTPFVTGAKVKAEVVIPVVKDRKIFNVKYKKRKGYRRRVGHRQRYTRVKITALSF